MKWEITVITNNGRRHVEEIDTTTFAGPIPLPAQPTAAITGAGAPNTQQFDNPITLPSGIVGDVYDMKPLHYHGTHLYDDEPTTRIYP